MHYCSIHPLKMKAKGRPVINIPVTMFVDDTSGNKSKKWNKFIEWTMMIAGENTRTVVYYNYYLIF